jgi:class 3 adenylate cyclase
MSSVRRLTAIFAADVAGYSRLMGADEEGTHARVTAHFRELVNPKIAHGRIVKNTGDGCLAEFASVVDALRCAVEMQRGMAEREPEVPEEQRIRFRIGINLGDVIVEEHDIFGDGVNVAARLEGLAEPGGVLVSNTVYEHVRDRLPFGFEDLGEQQVKNIARPVRVYALRPEGIAGLPTASVSSSTSSPPPAVAPRLSIVVLPFSNLSNDPEQQYFADGITEDLTTDLSRYRRHVRDLTQYCVYLPREARLSKADWPRIGCPLCAGGERPAVGQAGSHQHPAHRRRHQRAGGVF